MNDLCKFCNKWHNIDPYDLLDTPSFDIFYKYPPFQSISTPKLPMLGGLPYYLSDFPLQLESTAFYFNYFKVSFWCFGFYLITLIFAFKLLFVVFALETLPHSLITS